MQSREQLLETYKKALEMAGFNTTPGERVTGGELIRELERLSKSDNKRLAAAAKRKLEEITNQTPVDGSFYESPPETPPLEQIPMEKRLAEARESASRGSEKSSYED